MKKLITLFASFLLIFGMNAQTVPNGDFESWTGGIVDDWIIDDAGGRTTYSETTGELGSGMKITLVSSGSGLEGEFMSAHVTGIIPGGEHIISTSLKGTGNAGSGTGIRIRYWDTRWYNSSNVQVGSDIDESSYGDCTTDWGTYSITATAPADADYLVINYRVYGYDEGFELTVDNITVTGPPAGEVDWCNLQHPPSGTIDEGDDYTVYAQVYEAGVTEPVGQGAGIDAWIGYNTENTDPNTWTNWVAATYNGDSGNNDEYMADIAGSLTPGTYYYASRFQLNGGVYSYGGYNAGGGGFWDGSSNVSGVLTVNSLVPEISDVTYTPTTPTSSDDVLIEAMITDAGTVTNADLLWGTVSGVYTSTIDMDNGGSGDTYTATVAAMASGTTVYFAVFAENDDTYSATSSEYSFTFTDIPTQTLFFSEYIEGTSFNKAIEIYNGTGETVDLTNYVVNRASNGGGWSSGSDVQLSGNLEDGEVFIIANASADAAILDLADITSDVTNYNGNDALGLFYMVHLLMLSVIRKTDLRILM
jgi:hypothetical protein